MAAITHGFKARAGVKASSPVSIFGQTAGGYLGSTRNFALNNTEYIYCSIQASTSSLSASCYANDGLQAVHCTTTNARLIEAIEKMPPDCGVSFSWDAGQNCTQVVVALDSRVEVKLP